MSRLGVGPSGLELYEGRTSGTNQALESGPFKKGWDRVDGVKQCFYFQVL